MRDGEAVRLGFTAGSLRPRRKVSNVACSSSSDVKVATASVGGRCCRSSPSAARSTRSAWRQLAHLGGGRCSAPVNVLTSSSSPAPVSATESNVRIRGSWRNPQRRSNRLVSRRARGASAALAGRPVTAATLDRAIVSRCEERRHGAGVEQQLDARARDVARPNLAADEAEEGR